MAANGYFYYFYSHCLLYSLSRRPNCDMSHSRQESDGMGQVRGMGVEI